MVFSILSDVAVVIALHLDKKGFGLSSVERFGQDFVLDHVDDLLAVSSQLALDARFVAAQGLSVLGILGILFDCCNSAASGTLRADEILEGN